MIAAVGLVTSIAFGAIAATLVGVALLVSIMQRFDGPDDADDSEPGDGGGGPPPGDPPSPADSGGEPQWWPDFERQLHAYVARQRTTADRLTRSSAGASAGRTIAARC